jgi:hypothetical protein
VIGIENVQHHLNTVNLGIHRAAVRGDCSLKFLPVMVVPTCQPHATRDLQHSLADQEYRGTT